MGVLDGQATVIGTVDRDYVGLCIAEQVVRIKLSMARRLHANPQAQDTSALLTRPLYELAASLGMRQRVVEMVSDALAGAA